MKGLGDKTAISTRNMKDEVSPNCGDAWLWVTGDWHRMIVADLWRGFGVKCAMSQYMTANYVTVRFWRPVYLVEETSYASVITSYPVTLHQRQQPVRANYSVDRRRIWHEKDKQQEGLTHLTNDMLDVSYATLPQLFNTWTLCPIEWKHTSKTRSKSN